MLNCCNPEAVFNRCPRTTGLLILLFALVAPVFAQPADLPAAVRQQIRELQQEKASRSAVHRKLDSQFIYQLKQNRGQAIAPTAKNFRPDLKFTADGRVLVDIDAQVTDGLLDQIRTHGGDIISSVPRFDAIRATVPLELVETLATNAEVKFIRRAVPAMTRTGTANSQGDATHAVATARSNFAVNGSGVRIGVLSDSVDYYTNSITSGDLPAGLTILSGQSGIGGGNSGEGTAMLEIVHDLAPGADLAFATAFASEASFAQNILNLRTNGCDIIVDDVFYFDESPFQDTVIAQAVNAVTADGALYFSSAGNGGNKNDNTSGTWEGDFLDGGAASSPITDLAGRVHNFGGANYNTIVGVSGVPIVLFWSDPWGASTNDYDLYVLDSAGTNVLSSSTSSQTGTQNPWEYISSANTGNRIVIVKSSGTNRFLHLQLMTSGAGTLSTSTAGAIAGHCAATNAFAVAATRASNSYPNAFTGGSANPVEYFSSDGLRRIFYLPDGTPITPGNYSSSGGTVLQKPDITAANGVNTTVPGFQPFYGTSAAAPHAGAIAALLLSYNPGLTPAEVRYALTNTALNIEAAGVDRDSGAGIIMPQAALQSLPSIIFQSMTLVSETCPNNGIDPDETVSVSFTLKNLGPAATTNLVATLLTTNGVTAPGAPQNYGAIPVGSNALQTFSFTATGVCGSNITVQLQLQDGTRNLGTISQPLQLGGLTLTTNSFTNATAITIPTSGAASPFPSTISVGSLAGVVSKVTVTLRGITHNNPDDLDVLLVGPDGQKVLVMSDCGGTPNISGVNLTLDDDAVSSLPDTNTLTTGTYKPTNYGGGDTFASPAPGVFYATNLAAFSNTSPNGTWSLYVQDDAGPTGGSLASGWSLTLATATRVCCANSSPAANLALTQTATPALTNVGGRFTFTLNITNLGPSTATNAVITNTLSTGLSFVSATPAASFTNGNILSFSLGNLTGNARTNITIIATATTGGSRTNTATISSDTTDPTNANNSAAAIVTANAFPVISAFTNVTNNEDTVIGPLAFTVSDAETTAASLTVTASSTNTTLLPVANITLGGSGTNRTVTLTPATNQFGATLVTLTVSDGAATTSNSFNYLVNPVNDAPILAAISNRTIAELTTLTLTNIATDVDVPTNTLTFSMLNAPSNATLNAVSGVFTWTPTEAQGPSTNTISIIVTDNGSPSLSATQTFTVVVLETNSAPTLASISNHTLIELTTLTFTNIATDSDLPTNTLTFSMLNAPSNATLNAVSGVFTWTPTEAQGPGSNTISIIVTDNGSPSLSATQTFTVVVLETNSAPTLASISNHTLIELTTLTFTNIATDSDLPTNTLTFSMLNAPSNATLNAVSGVFTWTPTEAQGPGSNTISIIVTDNGSPSLSATQSFTVVILETNSAPTLAAVSNYTVTELDTLTFTNVATDTDLPTNALSFAMFDAPTNAMLDPVTGVFTWTPTEAQGPGSNHISIVVTDNGSPSLSTTQSFSVVVLETNSAPTLAPIPNHLMLANETLLITNTASDVDLPANLLTFSLPANTPTNAVINPTNGVFSWTPELGQAPSTNQISVIVTDDGSPSLSSTQTFTVTVLVSNVPPVLAALSNRVIHARTLLRVQASATSAYFPTNLLTYSLDAGAPANAVINATNGLLTWLTRDADAGSTNDLTVRVTDAGTPPLDATQTFSVMVMPRLGIQSVEMTSSNDTVTWNAIVGLTYQLQFKNDFGETNWVNATNVVTADSPTIAETLPAGSNKRYYRVIVP